MRRHNEDAFTISALDGSPAVHALDEPLSLAVAEQGVLLAVSDGLGGEQAGEVASALALHCLRVMLEDEKPIDSAEAALTRSVEAANRSVYKASAQPEHRGMGATLTAVYVHGDRAYVAEIGDSRAYLLRNGRFVQLTRDQSLAELMVEIGTLRRDQIQNFVHRNVVLQAVGIQPEVDVALNRVRLRNGDRLLLCSDGLSGKLDDEEIRYVLEASPDLRTASERLIDAAISRGGEDNITVVLADASGEALANATSDRISVEEVRSAPLIELARPAQRR